MVVRSHLPRQRGMNYARHQQYRRLLRAGEAGASGAIVALFGLAAASDGALNLAVGLLLIAAALGLCFRHQLSLAGRSRVGARSEDEVRRVLAPLRAEGWRVRHSLQWQGRGDIDSVAITPTGVAIAIETKTRTYDERHLDLVREQAFWLLRRRRRLARNGVMAVICLVRVRGIERVENDVLVVSIDRLTDLLRVAAGMRSGAPLERDDAGNPIVRSRFDLTIAFAVGWYRAAVLPAGVTRTLYRRRRCSHSAATTSATTGRPTAVITPSN